MADALPPMVLSEGMAAKVRRLVDEDRVQFAIGPDGVLVMAHRARVRSTSGESYDVWFDERGGVCGCQAAHSGRLCSHLAAAMIALAEREAG